MWRRLPMLMLLGARMVLSQSPSSVPARTEKKEPVRCTVSGQVISTVDKSPLKSARVTLVAEHAKSHTESYQSVSDSEGRFLLRDVAPGRYEFFAAHAGYVTEQYQSSGTSEGAVLALEPGENVKDVLFRLTPAAVVTGHVSDDQGEPMAQVEVTALQAPSDDELDDDGPFRSRGHDMYEISTALSDDRGQYRIFGLKPGEYYIRAMESLWPPAGVVAKDAAVRYEIGAAYPPIYYPAAIQLDQADVVSLRPGEEMQADFFMRHVKTVSVAGRVIGPKGPVTNGTVYINQSNSGDNSNRTSANTDEKGNFSLKGIPGGSYVITAYARAEGDKYYQGQQKIEVANDDIASVAIVLGIGATLRGRITSGGRDSPPFDRLHVILFPSDEEELPPQCRVEKNGTFEITSVKDGSYAVHVYGLEHEWYVKSEQVSREDVLENGLQVEKGNLGGSLDIVVSSDSAQLEGSVRQKEQPVVGARVRVAPDPETPYNRRLSQVAKTDQAGHFLLKGLAPRKYQVVARVREGSQNLTLKSAPRSVSLSEHDAKAMDLTIPPPPEETSGP